jgi:DnaJ-class molecular chaperone
MTRQEALEILELDADAAVSDIKTAHRRLMKKFHPDHNGSDYMAAKLNEAKDVLLKS